MSERKLSLALTLAIVLEVVDILRRAPKWLLYGLGLLALSVVYLIYLHPWLSIAILVAAFALRGLRRRSSSSVSRARPS